MNQDGSRDAMESLVAPDASSALPHRWIWRRAVLLLALCLILFLIVATDRLHAALVQVLSTVQGIIAANPVSGTVLFVVIAAVAAMVTFVSVGVVVPAAVYVWGPSLTLLLLWSGWILGGVVTYGIGRYLGRRAVLWLTASDVLSRFEKRVQRDAPFGAVLLLQVALPSEIPGYALGLARYPFPKYLLALAIAELPYTVATILLGESFVEGRGGLLVVMGVLLACLSVGAFLLLRRVMRLHSAAARPNVLHCQ